MCSTQCENLNLDLSRLLKRQNFFSKFSNCCFIYCYYFQLSGDSDFALSVKGVSVGIEDLQVYCIYYKQNILQYLHELFETGIIIYYPGVFLWFSFHPIQLPGSLHVILCPLIPVVPLVGGVLVFFLIRPLSRKLIETHIFDKKSCFLGCQYFITN